MDRARFHNKTELVADQPNIGERFSIRRSLQFARIVQRYFFDPRAKYPNYNHLNFNIYKIAALIFLFPSQALANAVSQSNNGSVSNIAIQQTTGNMTTNSYGPQQIQCQGATMALQPYTQFGVNYMKPFNHTYETPVYDPTDLVGDFDDEGNAIGDGVPDNPGDILYMQRNYSGTNKDAYSLNSGITLSFIIPIDRRFQDACLRAANKATEIQNQQLLNLEMDWHIARYKNCAELLAKGYRLKKSSPYYSICKDVEIIEKPNQVLPHTHKIISSSSK